MKTIIEQNEFSTANDLIEILQRLEIPNVLNLNEVFLVDAEGEPLTRIALEQEALSDGTVVFNLVLDDPGDPNS